MNAGEFDKRIIIRKLFDEVEKDKDGFSNKEWNDFLSIWANVKDLSGSAFYQLNSEQQVKTITCKVRYNNKIDESMRVIYRNEIYKVIRIYQGNYKDNFMYIDCQIIKGVKD
ncbi:phage head closure protein [Ruminiclostridium cellobioparum]|uniref:Phage head-tail adaptor, putative, SPP1 family n=1 Tax=Ruminiclostridium cellobioparum subsp. termitidis CT1112 TaxID=1195236 RepID=S0FUM6_RUMCE|nr:phage head closure protein [Ruminiclostridium cellobioparum]EMS74021.1 phage head-tail adaptor, putative, SPP1 family [Ruminiclostridium cellobioparum subsp. termitidis CT1112]